MMPNGDFSGLSASTSKMILDLFDYCENTPINKTMHKNALQQIVNDHVPALHIDIVLMFLEKRNFITINDSFTFTFNFL
jgi:hypothetical protein